jgi:prepilin-type N-terminal cleavage/methylation domain-containing protein/prepilin-type processing-associated H-X9-DG protein
MKRTSTLASRPRGFTLVELLVVIGIIALLMSILIPALKKAQQSAFRVRCAANMRTLQLAWGTYSDDWKGWLVWGHNNSLGAQIPWFLGDAWINKFPGMTGGNTEAAIREGSLFKYTRSIEAYHCTGDFGWHLCSYGIQCNLNGETFSNPPPLMKRAQIRRPSEVFVFIEENDVRNAAIGYNIGSFGIPKNGDTWIDYPAAWHTNGVNLSFADGHVEYRQWGDKRTVALAASAQNNVNTPNNVDLKMLQRWAGW